MKSRQLVNTKAEKCRGTLCFTKMNDGTLIANVDVVSIDGTMAGREHSSKHGVVF